MILTKTESQHKSNRIVSRKTNKLSNMSKNDMIEFNDVTKKTRGLSKITYKDIFEGNAN